MNKYLKFFRVFDWIHLLGITLLGLAYTFESNFGTYFFSLLIASLYLAYGYSINECFDNYIKNNHEKATVEKYHFSLQKGICLSLIPIIIALLIASLYSLKLILLIVVGITIGWNYSAPPLRLKSKPVICSIWNSLCFCPLFLIGPIISLNPLSVDIFYMSIFISLVMLPLQLIHELGHGLEDRSRNLMTTANKLGHRKTLRLIIFALFILIIFVIFLCVLFDMSFYFVIATLLFSLALFLFLLKRYDSNKNKLNTSFLKIHSRYISIIYGICILIIFALRK